MIKTNTIAGISTTHFSSAAAGSVGIVRLSGERAIEIVRGMFRGDKTFAGHTITYGHIVRGSDVLDEVLVSVMRAPKSYTREDVVEINCHGGSACVRAVLELALNNGARLAEPGEFTKRAFLNGRIDLAQAEAVMDIIAAKTELSRGAAMARLTGRLGGEVKRLRDQILGLVAGIETSIDYPEHDMEHINLEAIQRIGGDILSAIERLLETAKRGRLIKDGIETVIVGRPNVGKSSL
ncbi:MAG: tRNA uridine-5-carboxymethylaminomethyl(34) synthesis GTPase MnmE, partial [Defluviitaleaceae bacterium]|nr:tRNA uridine-5-carboxymethylaminomethyl(34) synthesis GTPase MnmE [Defluviitaleaceae bacterium]